MQELKELTEDLLKKGSQLAQRYADSVQENISLKSKNKELRHKVEMQISIKKGYHLHF